MTKHAASTCAPCRRSSCTAARLLDVRSAVRSVIACADECSSSGIHSPWAVSTGSSRLVSPSNSARRRRRRRTKRAGCRKAMPGFPTCQAPYIMA